MDFIQSVDWSVLYYIQHHLVSGFNDRFMLFFTFLGNGGFLWILLSVIFIFSRRFRRLGIVLAVALIFELAVGNGVLKHFFERPRPCWLDRSVRLLVSSPRDYSFPSAHAFSSFICATVVWMYNKKWGAFAMVVAFFISFSRLYLFVHFPSDVLTGAVLGVVSGVFVYGVCMKFFEYRDGI